MVTTQEAAEYIKTLSLKRGDVIVVSKSINPLDIMKALRGQKLWDFTIPIIPVDDINDIAVKDGNSPPSTR